MHPSLLHVFRCQIALRNCALFAELSELERKAMKVFNVYASNGVPKVARVDSRSEIAQKTLLHGRN